MQLLHSLLLHFVCRVEHLRDFAFLVLRAEGLFTCTLTDLVQHHLLSLELLHDRYAFFILLDLLQFLVGSEACLFALELGLFCLAGQLLPQLLSLAIDTLLHDPLFLQQVLFPQLAVFLDFLLVPPLARLVFVGEVLASTFDLGVNKLLSFFNLSFLLPHLLSMFQVVFLLQTVGSPLDYRVAHLPLLCLLLESLRLQLVNARQTFLDLFVSDVHLALESLLSLEALLGGQGSFLLPNLVLTLELQQVLQLFRLEVLVHTFVGGNQRQQGLLLL